MKIVSVDKVKIYPEHVEELEKLGEVVIYDDVPDEAEGIERIADAQIVIDNWYEMPSQVISSVPNLEMICVAATGYEWIAIDKAKDRGIVVCNSPDYSTEAVAEHTVGLLLSAARLASQAENDVRQGIWKPVDYRGKELRGRTLGVIGYGNIGRRVAEICQQGFTMKIRYVNSKSSRAELEELLGASDFISINAPLNEQTERLLGPKEFDLMKPGVVIANTGRGAIIDEVALREALVEGRVFAAGLDVLVTEPMEEDDPLFTLPNVVVTPHIGFNSAESEYRLSQIVTENIKAFVAGRPQNVVVS